MLGHNDANYEAFWMPFTANRRFKAAPRIVVSASGMYYHTDDGRPIMDGTAGLWCVGAGHGRREIAEAVKAQLSRLDFAPAFQIGHPEPFRFTSRLASLAPGSLDHVFLTCSGSDAVETALKVALGYHRAKGRPGRARLIGRERAYHGATLGAVSVSGIGNNRKQFGALVSGVDHLPHTHDLDRAAFSRGQPAIGAEYAEALERLVALHDASNIAAVIVEPIACTTGVLVPPAGYLQRLREICTKHGILLIFDEVATACGRTGDFFAAQTFNVQPDMIVFAKAITNATIPLGGVLVSHEIYEAVVSGADGVEFFHGFTYSGHPVACAAANATLSILEDDRLSERVRGLAPYWEDALHRLRDLPHVIDIRNCGLLGAVELAARPAAPGSRGWDVHIDCWNNGSLVRATGDSLVVSPPLIIEKREIDQLIDTLAQAIRRVE
jgi:beta-alanine--pyruvate transaminase